MTMISEYINYMNEIFPSIDTNIKNGIKDYLSQFDITKPNWFSNCSEELLQGDIVSEMSFPYKDNFGNNYKLKAKGMMLSNTCDLTRDEFVIIAPLIPFDDSTNKKEELRRNNVSGKFCLSNSELQGFYIDFSKSTSFNRNLITELCKRKKIKKEYELSQFGFYFLLSKITVYYMRVENYEVFENRNSKMFIG